MYKFKDTEVIHNTLIFHPQNEFFMYQTGTYYQNRLSDNSNVPNGSLSLYEMNVNRAANNKIYPFIYKTGDLLYFKSATSGSFDSTSFGTVISGSYESTSSITRQYITGSGNKYIIAMKNTLNQNKRLSPKFDYANFSSSAAKAIFIPSIFYNNGIQKGSVKLDFYTGGTLLATAEDVKRNGELIQTFGTSSFTSGCVGVVLYNEGVILLTSSIDLNSANQTYEGTSAHAKWIYYGATDALDSSYRLTFNGTNKVPTMTMFAHAPKVELNYSNNPSYLDHSVNITPVSSSGWQESVAMPIKNIAKNAYTGSSESYEKITYISTIGIYDEHKNLIAVAKLAQPLRKRQKDSYTIKLKLDT